MKTTSQRGLADLITQRCGTQKALLEREWGRVLKRSPASAILRGTRSVDQYVARAIVSAAWARMVGSHGRRQGVSIAASDAWAVSA